MVATKASVEAVGASMVAMKAPKMQIVQVARFEATVLYLSPRRCVTTITDEAAAAAAPSPDHTVVDLSTALLLCDGVVEKTAGPNTAQTLISERHALIPEASPRCVRPDTLPLWRQPRGARGIVRVM